jgi:ABC-type Fe3+-siderophore transport system permease subunit
MLPLFQQLGILAFGSVKPTARRLSRLLIGGAVAALLGLTTYVALLVALGLYLSSLVGAPLAAVSIAGITALCALIAIAVIRLMNRRTELKMEARRRAARARLPDPVTLQLLAGLPGLLKGRSLLGAATVAALVYGVTRMQNSNRDERD